MKLKRLMSAVIAGSILTLSGINFSVQTAGFQTNKAQAQTGSCDTRIRSESFSRQVGSTTGINLRSTTLLSARTSQNVAYNQMVAFDGWTYGESVTDLWTGKPDALWYKLRGQNLWVPSAYMIGYPPSNPPIQPTCSNPPASSGQINLPFRRGQTMYVCQGYGGPISHRNNHAFDLTVARDFGTNNACWAANINQSANLEVLAPTSGTISYVNQDLVCLQIDANRSLLIGHMNRRVANGQRVTADTVLGTVSAANSNNGGLAHIHIEPRRSSNCAIGTSVPFTAVNGFQFNGIGDLPGLPNTQWQRELRRP